MTKTVYLTQNGLERFKSELEQLRTVKRPEIIDRIKDLGMEDEEEGGTEYQTARQDQAFLEGRILELERLIKDAVLIATSSTKESIEIGSTVVIKEVGQPKEIYTLVGSAEANASGGMISDESPLGKALRGHKVGDKVTVEAPSGSWQIKVLEVR